MGAEGAEELGEGDAGAEVAEGAPVVAVALFGEADDAGGHGDDAVPAQKADGLDVGAGSSAFADGLQGGGVVAFDVEEEADEAGTAVEVAEGFGGRGSAAMEGCERFRAGWFYAVVFLYIMK